MVGKESGSPRGSDSLLEMVPLLKILLNPTHTILPTNREPQSLARKKSSTRDSRVKIDLLVVVILYSVLLIFMLLLIHLCFAALTVNIIFR